MASKGQRSTSAHAAENMAVEMEYKEQLSALRRERSEKVQSTQAEIRAARYRRDADITGLRLDIEKRRLLAVHMIDQLRDQRTILRQKMHDTPEAVNDFNAGELMRLTGEIDGCRHRLLELDEERQLRTAQCKTIYENTCETLQNHIKQLHENYRLKERELREQLMETYRLNREKAEQQRQEGGGEV